MRRNAVRFAVLSVVAAVMFVPGAAEAASGADYGQHVAECAQTMGFDGVHNPGMHRGFSGWHPDHQC